IVKPLWPFAVASVVTVYLVGKAQDAGVRSEKYRNDPKNPYASRIAAEQAHH
ncbi:hypothetical protein FRB99_002152, partial [Tulasnella sp. 403]